jgi:hypothetical protein
MTSCSILTNVHLPPGPPSTTVVRRLLQLAFEEYRWFPPALSSCFGDAARLEPANPDYEALLAHYDECQSVSVMDRMDEDFLSISTSARTEFPFVGRLTWVVSIEEERLAGWLGTHVFQVMELMRLMGASLAQAGLAEDVYRKKERFIPNPDGFGTKQTFTVRDPSEGLTGLFWRNFFGPPFIRMFGERLLSLPPDTHRELGDGLVLVQPYALPTQAMTPEGDAAEQRLITVLGPECFYDHAHHRKPTRVPEFTVPPT